MAKKSSNKLTKYKSAQTIVTADAANSWYGGLHGSAEASNYESLDPLVAGHVHDGKHIDGHSQKVNLVSHVTGQLRNQNLADDAVNVRNVQPFLNQASAIPEFEVIGSDTFYYLDLSDLRASIGPGGGGAFETNSNVTSNIPGVLATDDFVFGSDTLENSTSAKASRVTFDKSKSAFRAGFTTSTQWNDANRGLASVAFGYDNSAAANYSAAIGGRLNTASGSQSSVVSGNSNISSGESSIVGSGVDNQARAQDSSILSGSENIIEQLASRSSIVSGSDNLISIGSSSSIIGAGVNNRIRISTSSSAIVSGLNNSVGDGLTPTLQSFLGGGFTNVTVGNQSVLVGGNSNILNGNASVIVGGQQNSTSAGRNWAFIGGGSTNTIGANHQVIAGGQSNELTAGTHSAILGGFDNEILASQMSFIGGGDANSISLGSRCVISGGLNNEITGNENGSTAGFIGGGGSNVIDSGTAEAPYNAIVGGLANTISNGVIPGSFSSYSYIGGGSDNSITSSDYSTISGGLSNKIDESVVKLSFANIRGGYYNRVRGIGVASDVGGIGGLGYIKNQFVIGGGYFEADGNGIPSSFGQSQTSIISMAGEMTSDGPTDLYSDFINSTGRLIVPPNSAVFAELTFIARDSAATPKVSGFKAYLAIRRDGILTNPVVADGGISSEANLNNSSFAITPLLFPVGGPEGFMDLSVNVSASPLPPVLPVRISAKVSWTQVILN